MKKGLTLLTIAAAVFAVFLCSSIIIASDLPETVVMESSVYETHKKAIVKLSHKAHAEDYNVACTDCHHEYKDGANTWQEGEPVKKCTECHSEGKKAKGEEVSKEDEMKRFHYTAIHENCKGCHAALKKESKATGPTTCTKCHVK